MSSNEVVTRSLVRFFDFPAGFGRGALITLDNGADPKRPNTFGVEGLRSLSDAIDMIEGEDLKAVLITSKPYSFSAGADLGRGGIMDSGLSPRQVAENGHATFRRLGELPFPSFALLNGIAVGGGLEIALQCTYRVSSAAGGPYALPEVHLGLIPGWGGAYLLPRLVGPKAGVKVIVENPLSNNRMLRVSEAAELGVVDAVLPAATFVADGIDWAYRVLTGAVQVQRREWTEAEWTEAIEGARAFVEAKTHYAFPAPAIAIGLIEGARERTRDEGFQAEDQALVACLGTPELRASLYAFNLLTRRSKRPLGVPEGVEALPVTRIGIVGGGLMATQIAMLFASVTKLPVAMVEVSAERAALTRSRLVDLFIDEVKRGKWDEAKARRYADLITVSEDLASLADCDFVIEAVFERLEVKQEVFCRLEDVVSETCLIVTNTSGLSITAMSEGMRHPERVVGMHFFNPVARMPLVEVIASAHTDQRALATAFAFAATLRKIAVRTADERGFVVNRLLLRQLTVLFDMIDRGVPLDAIMHASDRLGLPMNAFALLDLVGAQVALHLNETMHAAYPERFPVSKFLKDVVASGGKVLGADGAVRPEVAALAAQSAQGSADDARHAVEEALAQEIAIMLAEGVVEDASQIDLGMIVGAGWPLALGGICAYLDYSGVSQRINGKDFGVLR
jgi:3-hydroxyacyl-CoA dehydrogenase/enoyl-CoA hydratase/carnithine racemase